MKKIWVLMLAALLAFSLAATALAEEFDGVIIPSPEEYLGVPPCTGFSTQDNYYVYRYKDCGREDDGDGNNAIWALFEQYAKDLVSTGYFELAYRDDAKPHNTTLYLTYTGPEKYLKETFSTNRKQPDIYAVEIGSLYGQASVYYSIDIRTTNLDETLERLGYAPPSGDGDCTICDGDGNCNKCSGTGYIYKTVLRNGKHETVHITCDAQLCMYGNCTACGGDGDL